MGIFYETIGVGNPSGGDLVSVSALVDTGASYSMIPASLLRRLGIVMGTRRLGFSVADGRRVEYAMGAARFAIGNRERACPVVFGPEGRYLLGANTLEIFRLLVNPVDERLEPLADLGD